MPKPSLRELFRDTSKYHSYNPALYALLEALVEAVEPEEHTCGECQFCDTAKFIGCNYEGPIKRLWSVTPESAACDVFQPKEPEDTDATIRAASEWHAQARQAYEIKRKELTKAKADIERLRKERDSAELKLGALKAIDKRILADAELGKMARGMGTHTRLTKGDMLYKAETKEVGKWVKTYPDRTMFLWNDLIDALRAIREMGDDKA